MGATRGEISGASQSDEDSADVEGSTREHASDRVEFPSYEQANACYDDPAYQEARQFALQASERELLIFEGELG